MSSFLDMDLVDKEIFINEIRKRPAIWDTSSEDHKNRQMVMDKWTEVCICFFPDYLQRKGEERKIIGKGLQLKWRHIRDAYIRNIRQNQTRAETGDKPIRSYILARQMEFLRKVTKYNEAKHSSDQSHSIANYDDEAPNYEINSEPYVAHLSQSSLCLEDETVPEERVENYTDPFQQQGNRGIDVDNEDVAFFRSILPTVQTLRQDHKLRFRVEVMNLLLRYYDPASQHT